MGITVKKADGAARTNSPTESIYMGGTADGLYQEIERIVVTSSVSSVVFGVIPQLFESLFITGSGRCDRAAATDELHIRFNGLSTNIYTSARWYTTNDITGDDAYPATSKGFVSFLPGTSATSGFSIGFNIWIPNYTKSGFVITWNSQWAGATSAASAGVWVGGGGGIADIQTRPITSITFVMDTGANIISGTEFTLYGVGMR